MKTKNLIVDDRFGTEYKGKYVFQEISWAKRSRIIQKHTKYHPISGQVVKSDYVNIQAETVWASLKEQPQNKPLTLEKLLSEEEGVPVQFGELLAHTVNELCGVTHADLRFLLEQLSDESRTRLFQSFGFVKNLDGRHLNSASNLRKQ